jgi:hypothetical protein
VPVCRRPTVTGAGLPHRVQVERPTGRTSWTRWGRSDRLRLGRWWSRPTGARDPGVRGPAPRRSPGITVFTSPIRGCGCTVAPRVRGALIPQRAIRQTNTRSPCPVMTTPSTAGSRSRFSTIAHNTLRALVRSLTYHWHCSADASPFDGRPSAEDVDVAGDQSSC